MQSVIMQQPRCNSQTKQDQTKAICEVPFILCMVYGQTYIMTNNLWVKWAIHEHIVGV